VLCGRGRGWAKFKSLYNSYETWCRESGEQPETKRRFGNRLTERGYDKDNGTDNVAIRRGIALRYEGVPGYEN
jgi:phage/plasmid-associated DNA primase